MRNMNKVLLSLLATALTVVLGLLAPVVGMRVASEVCPIQFDASTDGFGAWYRGAPCQRLTETQWIPCVQDPEDPCLTWSDMSYLDLSGNCPEDPCSLEVYVTAYYTEPCTGNCQPPCCVGSIVFTDGNNLVVGGIAGSPGSGEIHSVAYAPCSESGVGEGVLEVVALCEYSLGSWEIQRWGYHFTCNPCDP